MIIVTGGAGFIGSNIVKDLEQQGYHDTIVCDWLDHRVHSGVYPIQFICRLTQGSACRAKAS